MPTQDERKAATRTALLDAAAHVLVAQGVAGFWTICPLSAYIAVDDFGKGHSSDSSLLIHGAKAVAIGSLPFNVWCANCLMKHRV